jgi:methylamine dehydrogenase accessory protein MauD
MSTDRVRNVGWLLPLLLVVAVIAQNLLSVRILQQLAAVNAQMEGLMKTVVAASAPGGGLPLAELEPGTPAPAFAYQDTRGEERSLADYSGGPVLLVFSSPTCHYCSEFYPVLKTYAEESSGDPVRIVVLQIESTPEQNRSLREEKGLPFEVLAASADVFMDYEVPGTPYSVLLDESGKVVKSGSLNTLEQLRRFVTS